MFCSVFIVKYGSLWKRFWDHLIFETLDVVYDDVHVWVYVHISLSYRPRLQFIKVHCIYYPYLPKCTWRSNHPLRWQRRWLLLPVHGKPLVCEVGKGLLLATQETWFSNIRRLFGGSEGEGLGKGRRTVIISSFVKPFNRNLKHYPLYLLNCWINIWNNNISLRKRVLKQKT